MIPQQTAMPIETGAQTRSALERDTRLRMPPRANSPVNTHMPIGPTSGTTFEIRHPTRFEDEEGGERVDHDTGHGTGDPQPDWKLALILATPGHPSGRHAESESELEHGDQPEQACGYDCGDRHRSRTYASEPGSRVVLSL